MKLATLKDGSRDGQLVVVSRDLGLAHFATGIATRLQQALDDWNFIAPQLEDLYATLNGGKARHAFVFDPRQCMAPLPRAHQWAHGSACHHPAERLHPVPGAELPSNGPTEPRLCQGASDDLLGPTDDAVFPGEAGGIDFEAGLAVVTGDLPMGATPAAALDGVRLLMLANGWRLRALAANGLAPGIGSLQGQPAAAFGPLAVTPDELGDAWAGGRVHLALDSRCNGHRVGLCDAGEMDFHFGQLIAQLAKTRRVRAGSIVGSGAVGDSDRSHGDGCIAGLRALETLEQGAPKTGFLRFGDTVRIEMTGRDGLSVFGAIEQRVVSLTD